MVLTNENLKIKKNALFSQKKTLLHRKLFIVLFSIFFGIVSPLLLTESCIENFNNLRRSYLLNEKNNTTTITVPNAHWNFTVNKKELFYKNSYYDVQKVIQHKNQTVLIIVKDSFENVIKNWLTKNASKKEKSKRPITFFAEYKILNQNPLLHFDFIHPEISNNISLIQYNSYLFFETKPPIS